MENVDREGVAHPSLVQGCVAMADQAGCIEATGDVLEAAQITDGAIIGIAVVKAVLHETKRDWY